MSRGPLGGPRPASNSELRMIIVEDPVPTSDSEGVFPDKIIRAGADEEDLIDDIAGRSAFRASDLSVDVKTSFQRGLGQTDRYTINADVSGMSPGTVDDSVERLTDAGYRFASVEFN